MPHVIKPKSKSMLVGRVTVTIDLRVSSGLPVLVTFRAAELSGERQSSVAAHPSLLMCADLNCTQLAFKTQDNYLVFTELHRILSNSK